MRERVCVELGATRLCWNDWCARRGLTAGEGVRQLIAIAIQDDAHGASGAPGMIVPNLSRSCVGEPRSRIEIRLTRAEMRAVEQRAGAMGLRSNRWIVSLIRAQLTGEPQFGEPELRALCASSQQLAEMACLLGQLVRAGGTERVRGTRTSEWVTLKKCVDQHLRTTAALVRANLDRWSR